MTAQFLIPNGYEIRENLLDVSVDTAVRLLKSPEQDLVLSAKRVGDRAFLQTAAIRCPNCHVRIPWKRHFSPHGYKDLRLHERDVAIWGSPNLSFFSDEENELRKPLLGSPDTDSSAFHCPRCHKSFHRASKMVRGEYEIRGKRRVFLRIDASERDQVLGSWLAEKAGSGPVLREELEFNIKKGKVVLRLLGEGDKVCAIYDISGCPSRLSRSSVYYYLENNRLVKRRVLGALWRCGVQAISLRQKFKFFTVTELIYAVRFPNCPAEFYHALPFAFYDRGTIDRSFRGISKKIRTPQSRAKLYASSGLPHSGAVKELLEGEPALFFYLPEIAVFWSVFVHEVLLRLLKDEHRYCYLSYLHNYPNTASFFEDLSKIMGPLFTCGLIQKSYWYRICRYSKTYSSMSPFMKRTEKKFWKEYPDLILNAPKERYSTPVKALAIGPSWVDGFCFRPIVNHAELLQGDAYLQSRLNPSGEAVVIVEDEKTNIPCAFIEISVEKNMIMCFNQKDRMPIPENGDLMRAFNKWRKVLHLSYPEIEFWEDW